MTWDADVLQTTLRQLQQEAVLFEQHAAACLPKEELAEEVAECMDSAAEIRLFVQLYPEWQQQPGMTLRDVITARHHPEAGA